MLLFSPLSQRFGSPSAKDSLVGRETAAVLFESHGRLSIKAGSYRLCPLSFNLMPY